MSNSTTAHDIIANAVANGAVVLSLGEFESLNLGGQLHTALCKAIAEKEDRMDRRFALLACVFANVNGAKTEIDDFLPDSDLKRQRKEEEIKRNFLAYDAIARTRG